VAPAVPPGPEGVQEAVGVASAGPEVVAAAPEAVAAAPEAVAAEKAEDNDPVTSYSGPY